MTKQKLDCRIKSGNDKEIIYPLSFSCEHGRDTGIQETKELDYPVTPGNDKCYTDCHDAQGASRNDN